MAPLLGWGSGFSVEAETRRDGSGGGDGAEGLGVGPIGGRRLVGGGGREGGGSKWVIQR